MSSTKAFYSRVAEAKKELERRRANLLYNAATRGVYEGNVRFEIEKHVRAVLATHSPDADFHLVALAHVELGSDRPSYSTEDIIRQSRTPLWLTPGDDVQCFWTENHIINWLSLAHVLGMGTRRTLLNLRYWLKSRILGGFVELNSASYLPVTVEALCLLILYSPDDDIHNAALRALERLLWGLMDVVPSSGAIHWAQNRWPKYRRGYDHNISSLAWLLTGRGRLTRVKHNRALSCLLSQDRLILCLQDIVEGYRPPEDKAIVLAVAPERICPFPPEMAEEDEMMFRWANGEFMMDAADAKVVKKFHLYNHEQLKNRSRLLRLASFFPSMTRTVLSNSRRSPAELTVVRHPHRSRQISFLTFFPPSNLLLCHTDHLTLSIDIQGYHLHTQQALHAEFSEGREGQLQVKVTTRGALTLKSESPFGLETSKGGARVVMGKESLDIVGAVRTQRGQNVIIVGGGKYRKQTCTLVL